jgi:[acyl-carrier-protein] S-malonyltransferase
MSTNLSIVFPGQGSQSVGMLNAFADNRIVLDTMAEADAALGFSLSGLIANGPAEDLGLTLNTQPAMLAAAIAIYRVYHAKSREQIMAVAGHSLGEYTALVAAGVLDFADALKAVRFRAGAMQDPQAWAAWRRCWAWMSRRSRRSALRCKLKASRLKRRTSTTRSKR